jgi:preprotein translocase subunit SecE
MGLSFIDWIIILSVILCMSLFLFLLNWISKKRR